MKKSILYIPLFLICLFGIPSYAQNILTDKGSGSGEYLLPGNDASHPCITAEQYGILERQCAENCKLLGLNPAGQRNVLVTLLNWPLQAAGGLTDCSYYVVSAYLDQNTTTGAITDYNCGSNTYDGHHGTDLATYPFHFYKMDHDQVEVIAAAAGTIIDKGDGNFDRNCGSNSLPANYVIIQHADGSRILYWHMKKNSVTAKNIGQTVFQGEYLGVVGSSGSSGGPHLHFEVWSGSTSATYVDPFTGACNTLNATSWWAAQKPYTEPSILKASVHTTDVVIPPCPETETLNESTTYPLFFQGQGLPPGAAKFYIFIRNQTSGTTVNLRILASNGTTFNSWSNTFTNNYNGSYWSWTKYLPTTVGTYTFEATYNSIVCSQDFEMTYPTSVISQGTPFNLVVFPNPSDGKISILQENEMHLETGGVIEIFNMLGKRVFQSWISSPPSEIILDLQSGMYFYRVKDNSQFISSGKLIVK